MSDNLFNWNTKISQTSTGYGVTDDNNTYAEYNIKKHNVDTISKHSIASSKSTKTSLSGASDVKTQDIPTDMQSKISFISKPKIDPKEPLDSFQRTLTPELEHIMYKLNGELSTIQAYKADYDTRRNTFRNKIKKLGISNPDKILNIIEQYPEQHHTASSCNNKDVRFEHFAEEQNLKEEPVSTSIVNRAKSTVAFVHKCHVRYWWINAIVRIVTISVFLIMLYKLTNYKKN